MKKEDRNETGVMECKRPESLYGQGLYGFFKEADADIFCIQESKLQEGQISLELPGYHQYWNYAVKKGIRGPQFLRKKNLCPFRTDWGSRSMTRREGSLLWNSRIFIW